MIVEEYRDGHCFKPANKPEQWCCYPENLIKISWFYRRSVSNGKTIYVYQITVHDADDTYLDKSYSDNEKFMKDVEMLCNLAFIDKHYINIFFYGKSNP